MQGEHLGRAHLTWTPHNESVATPGAGRKLGDPALSEGSTWTSPQPDPKLDALLEPHNGEVLREVAVTAYPLAELTYEGPDGPEVLWVGGTDGSVDAPAIEARKAAADRHRRRLRMSLAVLTLLVAVAAAALVWTLQA